MYYIFITGRNRDGEVIATTTTRLEAIRIAEQYYDEHETEFHPVWGGVGIEDAEGNIVEW